MKINPHDPKLREVAKSFDLFLSWYRDNPENESALKNSNKAEADFRLHVGGVELEVIADLLKELEAREKAERQLEELVMFAKRLAFSLGRANPDSPLPGQLAAFLCQEGLTNINDVLR